MKLLTRAELGNVLSAQMRTKTVKSDYLKGTVFEEWELTEDWLVTHMYIDDDVLVIECQPTEYARG